MNKILLNCNVKIRISPVWLTNMEARLISEDDITEGITENYYVIKDETLRKE